jgi:hypothetical protein
MTNYYCSPSLLARLVISSYNFQDKGAVLNEEFKSPRVSPMSTSLVSFTVRCLPVMLSILLKVLVVET